MRRIKLAGVTVVAMSAVTMFVGGFTSRPAQPAHLAQPAHGGREVIKIVGTTPGPRHAQVTAKGPITAKGYFFRKKASLIFPKGRLTVRRHLDGTTYTPPNLATCWFKLRQTGTFRVSHSTGKYRAVRYSGQFWTNISGRLNRIGPDQCGSKIVYYRSVTYEIGDIP